MDTLWHITTRSERGIFANRKYVDRTDYIAWGCYPTLSTRVCSFGLTSAPTVGAGLRTVCFVHLNSPTRFVVKHPDKARIAGGRYLLCPPPAHLLSSIIERLAHIALRIWKCRRHTTSSLMQYVRHTTRGFSQKAILPPLSALVPPTTSSECRLTGLHGGQPFIAPLDSSLRFPTGHKYRTFTVGSGNQGVHTQINPNNRPLRNERVLNLIHKHHPTKVKPDFHQPPNECDTHRYTNRERTGCTVGKRQPPSTQESRLIGVYHALIAGLLVGVSGFLVPPSSKLACAFSSLYKVGNDLLYGLGVQPFIPTLCPLLPAFLSGPAQLQSSDAYVPFNKVAPKTGSFNTTGSERSPLSLRTWLPSNFYRAITHI